ncbi:MAG: hypothetical protein MRQ09_02550 [Candidatus Midichloria sp.]|nr:hypothetical protein [Candidatus Midichloria sp.]
MEKQDYKFLKAYNIDNNYLHQDKKILTLEDAAVINYDISSDCAESVSLNENNECTAFLFSFKQKILLSILLTLMQSVSLLIINLLVKVPSSFPRTKPKACNYALQFVKG